MINLTENPKIVVLLDPHGKPIAQATNVSKDVKVVITDDRGEFEEEAKGMPFDSTRLPEV